MAMRTWRFGGDLEALSLNVTVVEDLRGNRGHGLHVWPSAIALAAYVWARGTAMANIRVLELGAGVGLPGLLAAKLGAYVTLSDACDQTQVLENLTRACQLNNVSCNVVGLTWGAESDILDSEFDLILGADVLYDSDSFEDLFATVAVLLRRNKRRNQREGPRFIMAYHHRVQHRSLEHSLAKFGLHVTKVFSPENATIEEMALYEYSQVALVEVILDAIM